MKLIAGLGNPGFRYRNTRHNIGFMVVNGLAKKHGIRIGKRLFEGLVGKGNIKKREVFLLLPQTFMNLSGVSVKKAAGKIADIDDTLVVYDDIDLALGNIRFRAKGSGGGHKGLGSVIKALNTESISRLRIGIKPKNEMKDITDFVLRSFLKEENEILQTVIETAVDGIERWIVFGIEECMRKYNRSCV